MRIGEFAEVNSLTVDTVRYYVDLNLIHPERRGKYFYFTQEQQQELDRLLNLKKLRFTLEQIKQIMTVQELGKIKTTVGSSIYQDCLLNKCREVKAEMNNLTDVLAGLEAELESLEETETPAFKEKGIAFRYLQLLCCPGCGKDVEVGDGVLKGSGIFQADCQCSCGRGISINEGIVVVKRDNDNIIDPYVESRNYVDEFVGEAPKSFADHMMNSAREVVRQLLVNNTAGKAVLFMKSGLGALEAAFLGQGGEAGLIIMLDDDISKLRVAKKTMESSFPGTDILYVCSGFFELPVKKAVVDVAVDFPASFINGFSHDDNMYEFIIPLLKQESTILGLYLYFRKLEMLNRLPENRRSLFNGRAVTEFIKSNGFEETGGYEEAVLREGSNINNFFREGDIVYSRLMFFKRTVVLPERTRMKN